MNKIDFDHLKIDSKCNISADVDFKILKLICNLIQIDFDHLKI